MERTVISALAPALVTSSTTKPRGTRAEARKVWGTVTNSLGDPRPDSTPIPSKVRQSPFPTPNDTSIPSMTDTANYRAISKAQSMPDTTRTTATASSISGWGSATSAGARARFLYRVPCIPRLSGTCALARARSAAARACNRCSRSSRLALSRSPVASVRRIFRCSWHQAVTRVLSP